MPLITFIFKIYFNTISSKLLNIGLFSIGSFTLLTYILDEPLWILYNSKDTHIFSDYLITIHIAAAIISFSYFYITIFFLLKSNFFKFLFIFFSVVHTKISILFCILTIWTGIVWGLPIWGSSVIFSDGRLLFMLIYLFFLIIFFLFLFNYESKNINWKLIYIFYFLCLLFIPLIKFVISHWSTLHQPDAVLGFYFDGLNLNSLITFYLFIYFLISLYIYKELFFYYFLSRFFFIK